MVGKEFVNSSPEHLDGARPGTVARQVEHAQPYRRVHDHLGLVVPVGVVPGCVDVDRPGLLSLFPCRGNVLLNAFLHTNP
jgi:hypothetical protein